MAKERNVSFVQARKDLSRIVDEVSRGGRSVVITKRQKPVAVVLGLDRHRPANAKAGAERRILKIRGIARGAADLDRAIEQLRRSRTGALLRSYK